MKAQRIGQLFAIVLALVVGAWCRADVAAAGAAQPASADGVEFFEKKVRPLLSEQCYQCHSPAAPKGIKGGLSLDTREGLLRGGDSGPAVVAGQPDASRLIRAVRWKDDKLQMPPKKALAPEQVAVLEQWVKVGAPDPRGRGAGGAFATPAASGVPLEEGKKFWSYQPVNDPPIPAVHNPAWPAGAVDYFVLAKLEEKGLQPAPPVDKRALIRRATFDLTGLPPTPEEVEAFIADGASDAFAKVVDRLLASPAYGERWGRHWLDVVRYADTSGCNSDFPIPAAGKYRDWVVKSFNEDKPYDRFLREQLAGDLLPAKDAADEREHLIATGYLAIARRFGSRNNENHLTVEDTIDNVGKVMLGLSVSCARCHDHKFDPIYSTDYYGLYGIFASTRLAFPGTEIYRHTKDFVPVGTDEEVKAFYDYQAELASLDDRIEELTVERAQVQSRMVALDTAATDPGLTALRAAGQSAALRCAGAAPAAALLQMATAVAQPVLPPGGRTLDQVKSDQLEAKNRQQQLEYRPPKVEKIYAATEGLPADAKVQRKGDPKALGEDVPRGFLKVLGGQPLDRETAASTSGRLQLAGWIVDRDNPLTARVMVNRIWQQHFGKGIVQTPNDFGTRGKRPTHPELLDWLASRFVEGGWSVKAMHRLVMLSRAYQMGSQDNSAYVNADPTNDLLWKFDQRRLSAEEIRDSLLQVSGILDRSPAGDHPFPDEAEWRYTQHRPFVAVYETNHRSIYLMQQRIRKHPFLSIFDGADTNATTATRSPSTTPVQALFLMNDKLAHEAADKLGVRVGLAFNEDAKRIDYAYRLCFGRPSAEDEVAMAVQYLQSCRERLNSAAVPWDQQGRAALASYMRVLMSSNEFLYVD
jgi:hypothetical protein